MRGLGQLFIKYGWFLAFYGLLAAPILFSNRYFPGNEDAGPIWTDAIRQKVFLEMPIWALMGYSLWLAISKWRNRISRTVVDRDTVSQEPPLVSIPEPGTSK